MYILAIKEWRQFFSSLTGYLVIIIFLLLNGLLLFVFPSTSLLDFGYATLNSFFNLAPWVLLFLVPAVTMRSFADEYRQGTFELLKTLPFTPAQIVYGKFFGALLIILLALVPTIIYAVSMQALSTLGGLDTGATSGSYCGLILLASVFTAAGICTSSYTNNMVIAFISAAGICLLLFMGFEAVSMLPVFSSGTGYYIEMLGLKFHYNSISKGVIDMRDTIYFLLVIFLFMVVTQKNISIRQ